MKKAGEQSVRIDLGALVENEIARAQHEVNLLNAQRAKVQGSLDEAQTLFRKLQADVDAAQSELLALSEEKQRVTAELLDVRKRTVAEIEKREYQAQDRINEADSRIKEAGTQEAKVRQLIGVLHTERADFKDLVLVCADKLKAVADEVEKRTK